MTTTSEIIWPDVNKEENRFMCIKRHQHIKDDMAKLIFRRNVFFAISFLAFLEHDKAIHEK